MTSPKTQFAVGALVLFAFAKYANALNQNVSINARIYTALSVNNIDNMDFGILNVAAAGTISVEHDDSFTVGGGVTAAGGTPGHGGFDITAGQAGAQVILDVAVPTVNIACSTPALGTCTALDTMSVSSFTAEGNLTLPETITINATGNYFGANYGATLNVGAGQPTGTYIGSFTATASYN